jgi:iron complex outermembrane receptor protein
MGPKLAVPILLISLISSEIDGQGIVKGTVSDRESRDPLAGVYVLFGKGTGTVTDSNGQYTLRSDSAEIKITFQYVGFRTVTRLIKLTDGETKTVDIELETEINTIDQVVVTADRIEHKLSQITVSVDVIRSDFITGNHITDAQELITKSSGIEVLDGQASIRGGSGFSYGVGSRVLALVDGLPLLSPDAGGIRWQYLPMENLAQVEVIKGASSVLYGSSALNGIISFRSADASNIPVTKFFTEGGLYLQPRNKEWKWWNSPRPYSTTSFSHLRKTGNTDIGIIMNFFLDNSYRKYNDETLGKLNLRIKHFDRKTEGLSYGLNLSSGLTSKTDFLLWESADNALVQDTSSVAALNGRFLAVDPFISYNRKGKFRHDLRMRIQSTENRFPVKTKNNSAGVSVYSEYQLWYSIFSSLNLTGGISETWNRINSNFFGDHSSLNLAAFTQVEYKPTGRLNLVGGVRFEENMLDSERDKIVPVFRTGVNWQAAQFTFVRASFGEGYRFPSIAEKYASTTLGSVQIFPNPYVTPESGWSTEAGVKQGFRSGQITGQADLALFFSQNKNLIEYNFGIYPEGVGFQAVNVEHSRIYGSEIEFMLTRSSGKLSLSVTGGYTFIYPVEFNEYTNQNTDVYLKYRRKHSAKFTCSANWNKLQANLNLLARSKILNIDEVFLSPLTREQILPGFFDYWMNDNKGYFMADAGIGYKIAKHFTLSFAVKNLGNTEYMGRPGDIQPVRNISLRVSGDF